MTIIVFVFRPLSASAPHVRNNTYRRRLSAIAAFSFILTIYHYIFTKFDTKDIEHGRGTLDHHDLCRTYLILCGGTLVAYASLGVWSFAADRFPRSSRYKLSSPGLSESNNLLSPDNLDFLAIEEPSDDDPAEHENLRRHRDSQFYYFIYHVGRTEVDARNRTPGLFPGDTSLFSFENGADDPRELFELSVGHLLQLSGHCALLEVLVRIPIGTGDHPLAMIQVLGLLVTPSHLLDPERRHSLMSPVFREDDCQEAWQEAQQRCVAGIMLHFGPVHPTISARLADPGRDDDDLGNGDMRKSDTTSSLELTVSFFFTILFFSPSNAMRELTSFTDTSGLAMSLVFLFRTP